MPVLPGLLRELPAFRCLKHFLQGLIAKGAREQVCIILRPDIHNLGDDPLRISHRFLWCFPPDITGRQHQKQIVLTW